MPNYFVNTLNGIAFANAIATFEESMAVRSQTAPSSGKGGRYSAGSLFDSLNITLAGLISGSDVGDANDPGNTRAAADALKAMLLPGGSVQLKLDSDRYANVEVSSDVRWQAWGGLPNRGWSCTLASYEDPPWWSAATTTQALVTGNNSITTAGNGPADPVFTLTFSAASSVLLTLAGKSFALTVPGAGTYIVDSHAETVTAGGVDATRYLSLSSQFLRLAAGANTLSLTDAGGVLSVKSVAYQNRWY